VVHRDQSRERATRNADGDKPFGGMRMNRTSTPFLAGHQSIEVMLGDGSSGK
jgi:hypothetical protein